VDHVPHVETSQLIGHAWELHACVSAKAGQIEPPYAGDVTTARRRVVEPPPHVAEQVDQLDHAPTSQLIGHAAVLQPCTIVNDGHGVFSGSVGCCVTVRVAVWLPPPHLAEHSENCDHADTWQPCTGAGGGGGGGHRAAQHNCCSVNDGHAAPPFLESVTIDRDRRWVPPPHEAEQTDHAVHSETTQSTAHACVLHACSRFVSGHAAPPFDAGVVTVRVLVWTPPPHALEQAPHSDHDDTWHETAQTGAVHAWVSDRAGHAAPPYATGVVTERVRVWTPTAPHVDEHADHALQPPTWQSTGHAWTLHACVCVKAVHGGHAAPPLDGWVTT